jgi:hypothetical protein
VRSLFDIHLCVCVSVCDSYGMCVCMCICVCTQKSDEMFKETCICINVEILFWSEKCVLERFVICVQGCVVLWSI